MKIGRNTYIGILIGLGVIGGYVIASKYDLYFIFWWFDWLLHFSGGVALGYFFTGLFSGQKKYLKILFGTIAVALLWEVFERIGHRYAPLLINYGGMGDTTIDILCAILGASLVFLVTRER